jgi:hypothetical protein
MAEVNANEEQSKSSSKTSKSSSTSRPEPPITILDCFRLIFGLLLLNSLLSYFVTGDSYLWNYNPWWIRPKAIVAKLVRLITCLRM